MLLPRLKLAVVAAATVVLTACGASSDNEQTSVDTQSPAGRSQTPSSTETPRDLSLPPDEKQTVLDAPEHPWDIDFENRVNYIDSTVTWGDPRCQSVYGKGGGTIDRTGDHGTILYMRSPRMGTEQSILWKGNFPTQGKYTPQIVTPKAEHGSVEIRFNIGTKTDPGAISALIFQQDTVEPQGSEPSQQPATSRSLVLMMNDNQLVMGATEEPNPAPRWNDVVANNRNELVHVQLPEDHKRNFSGRITYNNEGATFEVGPFRFQTSAFDASIAGFRFEVRGTNKDAAAELKATVPQIAFVPDLRRPNAPHIDKLKLPAGFTPVTASATQLGNIRDVNLVGSATGATSPVVSSNPSGTSRTSTTVGR